MTWRGKGGILSERKDHQTQPLRPIPSIELDDHGLVGLAAARRDEARVIVDHCTGFFPKPLRWTFPVGDRLAHAWLSHNHTPYGDEIDAIAHKLGFPGAHLLNTAYEWGCTTAVAGGHRPRVLRTLDWPFTGLGRHVVLVRQNGPKGAYVHATWPGAAGVLTGIAPGRFAAALNMGPMRRRVPGAMLRFVDYGLNAAGTFMTSRDMPPAHLLRMAFEQAAGFDEALELLARTPVARPVIYTLASVPAGQSAIIERLPTGATVRRTDIAVANDWMPARSSWEGRSQSDLGGAEDCAARVAAIRGAVERSNTPFDWIDPPVRNGMTRLAVEMDLTTCVMQVRSYEPDGLDDVIAVGAGEIVAN